MVGGGVGVASLESRPGILLVGSPNVGKRTILSRLLSIDFADFSDSSDRILCNGWTIVTKYYSADLSVWTAQLDDGFSFETLRVTNQLAALVMVFDMNDMTSFVALQDWVSHTDILNFEILLCIGNKADLLPGHFAHGEYRRRLQKQGESSSDPHPEFLDYGILETEGSSLLGNKEPSWEIRRSCFEWCSQYNIEYIEACASNADFDKCLSVDGDMQGVERLYGALSAHMWPGMILKSGDRIIQPSPVEEDERSDEESDYEIEYEILSGGFDEPWDGGGDSWVSFSDLPVTASMGEGSSKGEFSIGNSQDLKDQTGDGGKVQTSTSEVTAVVSSVHPNDHLAEMGMEEIQESSINGNPLTSDPDGEHEEETIFEAQASTSKISEREHPGILEAKADVLYEDLHLGSEDLERLMSEITNMRDSLRLMPDFQRKEMAAKLAMKMAVMFGDGREEDGSE